MRARIGGDTDKSSDECEEEKEIYESEEQVPPEERLVITVRHKKYPEATLWTIVSRNEWQQAKTMTDIVTLFEKGTFGQTTEEVIKDTEQIINQRTEYLTSEMEKIREQLDEKSKHRYELLHKSLEDIRRDRKSFIQDSIEHKNKVAAKLEELNNSGLLEITEKAVEGEEPMFPPVFIERKFFLLNLE